jgi:hypothetical protein
MIRLLFLLLLPSVALAQFGAFEREFIVGTSNITARSGITLGGVTRTTWPTGGGSSDAITNNWTGGAITLDAANSQTNTFGGFLVIGPSRYQANGGTASGNGSWANWWATASGEGSWAHFYATASGEGSFAIGPNAQATNAYNFVWSDGTAIGSTANNQFTVYASNGIRLLGGPIEGDGSLITNVNAATLGGVALDGLVQTNHTGTVSVTGTLTASAFVGAGLGVPSSPTNLVGRTYYNTTIGAVVNADGRCVGIPDIMSVLGNDPAGVSQFFTNGTALTTYYNRGGWQFTVSNNVLFVVSPRESLDAAHAVLWPANTNKNYSVIALFHRGFAATAGSANHFASILLAESPTGRASLFGGYVDNVYYRTTKSATNATGGAVNAGGLNAARVGDWLWQRRDVATNGTVTPYEAIGIAGAPPQWQAVTTNWNFGYTPAWFGITGADQASVSNILPVRALIYIEEP